MQYQSAVTYLEGRISNLPDPRLHHTASLLMQKEGKLPDALEHAEAGAALLQTQGKSEYETGQLECVVQAAELSRALLLPERARQILSSHKVKIHNKPISSNYHVICAETALEGGEEIEAANDLSKAIKDYDTHSARLQALQSRLTARRGDLQTALTIFQSALKTLGDIETVNTGSVKPQTGKLSLSTCVANETTLPSPATLYPLTEAAVELNLWGIALRLAQKAVQLAPSEPLAHYIWRKCWYSRQNINICASNSDLVDHVPALFHSSEGTCRTFDQAIQAALGICERNSQRTHAPVVPLALARWQIRGKLVFTPTRETAQALSVWAGQNSTPGDIAASLAALRRMSIIYDQQVAYNNQQTGVVLTQIAISLNDKNPEEAVKALQIAIR